MSKITPLIQDSVGTAMDKLSKKVRPDIKYKTDRPELDGGANPFELIKQGINVGQTISETCFLKHNKLLWTITAVILQEGLLIRKTDYFLLNFGIRLMLHSK